jgi:hypothetical protein
MKQVRVAKQVEEATRDIIATDEQIRTLVEQLTVWEEMRDCSARCSCRRGVESAAEIATVASATADYRCFAAVVAPLTEKTWSRCNQEVRHADHRIDHHKLLSGHHVPEMEN